LIDQLTQCLQEFQRYGYKAALIMLDIDHFKGINDRYGHLMGDEVLCQVSTTCLEQLRKPDLLARFGGEEFAALLPGTDLNGARLTAERLRKAVARKKMDRNADTCSVTISIGVSAFLDEDRRIENVIKRTDDALYEAKRMGRNRVAVLHDGFHDNGSNPK
jgi:diguanylate cyclase (GGDEF)-like protein